MFSFVLFCLVFCLHWNRKESGDIGCIEHQEAERETRYINGIKTIPSPVPRPMPALSGKAVSGWLQNFPGRANFSVRCGRCVDVAAETQGVVSQWCWLSGFFGVACLRVYLGRWDGPISCI